MTRPDGILAYGERTREKLARRENARGSLVRQDRREKGWYVDIDQRQVDTSSEDERKVRTSRDGERKVVESRYLR